jgi:hypothetical protein
MSAVTLRYKLFANDIASVIGMRTFGKFARSSYTWCCCCGCGCVSTAATAWKNFVGFDCQLYFMLFVAVMHVPSAPDHAVSTSMV